MAPIGQQLIDIHINLYIYAYEYIHFRMDVIVIIYLSFQHTLVTEIRELVFPEDRTRYDELVYSRDPYLSDRDRHRVSVLFSFNFSFHIISKSCHFLIRKPQHTPLTFTNGNQSRFIALFCFFESLVFNGAYARYFKDLLLYQLKKQTN